MVVAGLPSAALGVSVGRTHSLALCEGGEVWAWGGSASGQCGEYPGFHFDAAHFKPLVSPCRLALGLPLVVVQVSAGQLHTALLTAAGEVYSCGAGGSGELGDGLMEASAAPRRARLPEAARAIDAGSFHTLALAAAPSRTVYGWGAAASGQLGPPPPQDDPQPPTLSPGGIPISQPRQPPRAAPRALEGAPACAGLAAGGYHSLLLSQQGRVFSCGKGASAGETAPPHLMLEVRWPCVEQPRVRPLSRPRPPRSLPPGTGKSHEAFRPLVGGCTRMCDCPSA